MKAVYTTTMKIIVHLKGDKIVTAEYNGSREYYRYGEVPQNSINTFDDANVFDTFVESLSYRTEETLIRKRRYVNQYRLGRRIYEDELVSFEVHLNYEVVDNPRIDWLEQDLGFKGYSELVFDREQELKEMLLKG